MRTKSRVKWRVRRGVAAVPTRCGLQGWTRVGLWAAPVSGHTTVLWQTATAGQRFETPASADLPVLCTG